LQPSSSSWPSLPASLTANTEKQLSLIIEARVSRMVAATKKLEADIGIDRSAFRETRWA
jgi:hypothetical protein